VVNVPYGGLFMPPAVAKRLSLKQEEIGWENFRLADPCLLGMLARACEAGTLEGGLGEKEVPERTLVSYSFSPLVADPLGFLASEVGDGAAGGTDGVLKGGPKGPSVIPRGASGLPLFDWTDPERELIFKKSALPYLAEVRDRVKEILDRDSLVLLVTARSYAARPWDYERDRRYPRPQLGIGALDGKRTPKGLSAFIGRTFKAFGLWPELDWPHRGAWVPPELAQHPRLLCCTFSFRRDLYMDEASGRIASCSEGLSRMLRTVFGLIEEELEESVKARYRRRNPPKRPSMVIKATPNPKAP
jgi:hypothetical protein